MNIPTIGGARGIFEIFVPGVFLLLNLGVCVYLSPFSDSQINALIKAGATNTTVALILAVSFGYLIGILLRLFRTDFPDEFSAWLLRITGLREHPRESKLWATDKFPYIHWLGESCLLYLSKDVYDFYERNWKPRQVEGANKQFINFVKTVISSSDEKASAEIYAAESLTRYISGMFFALSFAFLLFVVTILSRYFILHELLGGLIILAATYLLAILIILSRFRLIRIKEVEAIFAATYKNKALFDSQAGTEITKKKDSGGNGKAEMAEKKEAK